MPTLYFTNGTSKSADYAQAVKIKAILTGEAEPEDEQQARYVEQVADVDFSDMPKLHVPEQFVVREHDTKVDEILADETLTGWEKFKAVTERIRERQRGR